MSTSLDLEKAQSLSAGSQGGPDDKEVSPSEAVPSDATSPEHLTRALSARQVSMIAIGESPSFWAASTALDDERGGRS